MKSVFLAALVLMSGCTVVGPGEQGVRISLGKVSEDPKASGAYLWIPFIYGMASMNIQVQKSEIESTGASKDMQDVHTKIAINWSLSAENVVKTYQSIGDEEQVAIRILTPAVNEVMKAAISKRTAEEVLTHRLDMKKDIDDQLAARLKQYGISMHDVSIVDLKFSPDFAKAIEEKQIAEQQAKQASYIADKATQEARAEVERAKGQAEAQRLLQSSTTATILQQRAIDKWDGKFPQVMSGQSLPFINLKM